MDNTASIIPAEVDVVVEAPASSTNTGTSLALITADSLKHFDPQAQAEILKISEQIDPVQIEKIMAYGQIPLIRTYESAGRILKAVEGTTADQEVMKQVIELSKQANKNQEELNIALQEPNLVQKFLIRLFAKDKEQAAEVKFKAITSYRLLNQLRDSCAEWLQTLQNGYAVTAQAIEDDKNNGIELEKYLVAGLIAEKRLDGEVEAKRLRAEETGLVVDKDDYETHKEGLDAFKVVLLALQKSRGAYGISIGQLLLQREANKNLQMSVRTQMTHSMAIASQQLRNAILHAQNRAAAEGQRSITALNGELMKKVASNAVLTAEESEKLLLSGIYSIEDALTAAKTVVDGCNAIKQARQERVQHIAQEMDKLKVLVDEISPFINNMKEEAEATKLKSSTQTTATSSGLVF